MAFPFLESEMRALLCFQQDHLLKFVGFIDVINIDNLPSIVLNIRRFGRPWGSNRYTKELCLRDANWQTGSFRHLEESTWNLTPVVNDPAQVIGTDNLLEIERRADTATSPVEVKIHTVEDFVDDLGFDNVSIASTQHPEADDSCLDRAQGVVPRSINSASAAPSASVGVIPGRPVTSRSNTSSVFSSASQVGRATTGASRSSSNVSIEVEKHFLKTPEEQRFVSDVMKYYSLSKTISLEDAQFLADESNQHIINNGVRCVNPKFFGILHRATGQPLEQLCLSYYIKYYNNNVPTAVVDDKTIAAFCTLDATRKIAVLSLDLVAHPSMVPLPWCVYCCLERVHLPYNCPIFDTIKKRDSIMQLRQRCTGCHNSCHIGRRSHYDISCGICQSNEHVEDACMDPTFLRMTVSDVVNRVRMIIAVTQNLTLKQLTALKTELQHQ